jgi:polysaccharide transporter, PST family
MDRIPSDDASSSAGMPSTSLRQRAVRGAALTYCGQAVRLVLQTVYVIIMSRLLAPADFGLLAMVMPVYGLALMFQDLGLTQATVQRPQITFGQLTVLFWVNIGIGGAIALLLIVSAPAIGWFYGDVRATYLTRGFAVLVIIAALGTQHVALINRRMRFGYLAGLDISAFVLGTLGALAVALTLRTYWALFAAFVISTLVTSIGAWAGTDFVPGLPRREPDMGELLRLGRGIAGFNFFNFISRNLDNVLIGHAWGDVSLGLYDRAYKLLLFPLQQISVPLGRVMLPALSQLQHDPARYRSAYLRVLQQLLLVTQPAIVFAIASADTLVPALLGDAWHGSVPIFQWLGLAALLQPIMAAANWLFVSQGRGQEYMYSGAFNAAISSAAFLVGLRWGAVGVAAAYSVSQVCARVPVVWWLATRRGPVRLADIRSPAILYAMTSATSFLIVAALQHTASLGTIPDLAACAIASYAASLAVLTLMPPGRAMLRQSVSLIGGFRRQWQ